MVEKRVTDGDRIATLLIAELCGRVDGELHRVSVPAPEEGSVEAEPVPIELDGAPFATMTVEPSRVELRLAEPARAASLETGAADRADTLVVDSGAAVKRATDDLQRLAAGRTEE